MSGSERFQIEVPGDLARFIHAQVGDGMHATESEVIHAAVRIMKRRTEDMGLLRGRLDASIEDPRPSMGDAEVAAHLRRHARTMPARGSDA